MRLLKIDTGICIIVARLKTRQESSVSLHPSNRSIDSHRPVVLTRMPRVFQIHEDLWTWRSPSIELRNGIKRCSVLVISNSTYQSQAEIFRRCFHRAAHIWHFTLFLGIGTGVDAVPHSLHRGREKSFQKTGNRQS